MSNIDNYIVHYFDSFFNEAILNKAIQKYPKAHTIRYCSLDKNKLETPFGLLARTNIMYKYSKENCPYDKMNDLEIKTAILTIYVSKMQSVCSPRKYSNLLDEQVFYMV